MIRKTCAVSGKQFAIDDRDQAYYAKIGVPHPTLCPEERERRRWAWRGKNYSLRKCDQCGKMAMSYFSPDLQNIVTYCEKCFQSEQFDPMAYGRDFDFSRPFFDQFFELRSVVPRHTSNAYLNENSDYIICAHRNKNCYLVDEIDECRDCAFGYNIQNCEDVLESIYVRDTEIGYRLLKAEHCYATFFSENVFHCSYSAFLRDCRSCRHCLFCTGLINQEYHIFNKPVSEAEYQRFWDYIFAGKRDNLEETERQWRDFLAHQEPAKKVLIHTENCEGNYLTNCKDCHDCYYIDNCQDCRYCTDIHYSRDCYDVNIYEGELMYEILHAGPKGYGQYFSQLPWFCKDVYYCIELWNCEDCFGCAGLKKKKYCIFNKQYTKEEYEKLRDQIIAHMKETGEWGEFFPTKYSPHAYNHTMAQRFYPENAESVKQFGMGWDEAWESKLAKKSGVQTDVPANLVDFPADDPNRSFVCSETGKEFRFISTELKFYNRWKIPLPTNDPLIRIENLWEEMVRKRKG